MEAFIGDEFPIKHDDFPAIPAAEVQSLPTEVRAVTGPADAAKPQWSQVFGKYN